MPCDCRTRSGLIEQRTRSHGMRVYAMRPWMYSSGCPFVKTHSAAGAPKSSISTPLRIQKPVSGFLTSQATSCSNSTIWMWVPMSLTRGV